MHTTVIQIMMDPFIMEVNIGTPRNCPQYFQPYNPYVESHYSMLEKITPTQTDVAPVIYMWLDWMATVWGEV